MTVTVIPELPRERLWQLGATALTTVELVAILLGTGRAGQDARRIAQLLLESGDGSLRRLAGRPPTELLATSGIGRAKASRMVAALEIGTRLVRAMRPIPLRIRSPADVARAASHLTDLKVAEFHLLALNTQHEMTKAVLVTRGL